MERICKILNIDPNAINDEPVDEENSDTKDKNKENEAQKTHPKDPPYLVCKKFITESRPFVFETLTFLITLLFIGVFAMVMWYTIGRVYNTFKDKDVNHHNTTEFKA